MSSTPCAVCMEDFSTSRSSLMLECGHIFCETCISSIVSDENLKKCPTCNSHINYNSCSEIPKNYIVLNILVENCRITQDQKPVLSKEYCQEHNLKRNKWCDTHHVCICTSCTSSEYDSLHPLSSCSVRDFDISILRQTSRSKTEDFMSVLEHYKKKVNLKQKKTFNRIADLKDKLSCAENHFSFCLETDSMLKSLEHEVTKCLKLVQDSTNNLEGLINYETQKKSLGEAKKKMADRKREFLLRMKSLACLSSDDFMYGNYYAAVKKNNKTLFGRVWTQDKTPEAVFISNFKEKTPPINSKIIEMSDICSKYKFNQQNGYIRVSFEEEYYEEMFTVSLYKNNDYARNFFLLCSGLKGPSYEGCPVKRGGGVDEKCIISGYYEKDWTEGAAVLESFDINNCPEEYEIIGSVCGLYNEEDVKHRSAFLVQLNESKYNSCVFGRITSGLDVCQYLHKQLNNEPEPKVIISDCGVQVIN